MKKFKRIYIEITNMCNLNCSFCSNDNLKNREMTLKEFEHIIKEIKPYTGYIYLHVKGEPLLHSKLKEILNISKINGMKVNITTNGTLLKNNIDTILSSSVRQVNISLQSLTSDNYLHDIFDSADKLIKNKIEVVLRFWAMNVKFTDFNLSVIDKILKHYDLDNYDEILNKQNIVLKQNLYLNKQSEFKWPSLDNEFNSNVGYCLGLKTHMSILVDGTVIPCCLDSKGIINLGNIYSESFTDILNKERTKNILINFQNKKIIEELCQKCSYRDRFYVK